LLQEEEFAVVGLQDIEHVYSHHECELRSQLHLQNNSVFDNLHLLNFKDATRLQQHCVQSLHLVVKLRQIHNRVEIIVISLELGDKERPHKLHTCFDMNQPLAGTVIEEWTIADLHFSPSLWLFPPHFDVDVLG
jgi:hypothetical protein